MFPRRSLFIVIRLRVRVLSVYKLQPFMLLNPVYTKYYSGLRGHKQKHIFDAIIIGKINVDGGELAAAASFNNTLPAWNLDS